MSTFQTRDDNWEQKVRASFARQPFMGHLGAELSHVAPGAVDIEMAFQPELTQQHGFFHAGATSSIADSAAGYAALTLFPPETGVLTTEFKTNLLNPARGEQVIARGRVLKSGRTLTVCRSDVYALADGDTVHVSTGLFTMMCLAGMAD